VPYLLKIKRSSFLYFLGELSVLEWQFTATTIYCDAVDDDVTLIIDKNLNIRCVGYDRYGTNLDKETAGILKQKSRRLGRNLKCEGPQDFRVTDYRDKLIAGEKGH
jgi:hypothetical protein